MIFYFGATVYAWVTILCEIT